MLELDINAVRTIFFQITLGIGIDEILLFGSSSFRREVLQLLELVINAERGSISILTRSHLARLCRSIGIKVQILRRCRPEEVTFVGTPSPISLGVSDILHVVVRPRKESRNLEGIKVIDGSLHGTRRSSVRHSRIKQDGAVRDSHFHSVLLI